MSITLPMLVAMAVGTYLMRLLGLALAHRGLPERAARILPLIPGALLAGLVVLGGLTNGDGTLIIDARVAGMLAAALAAVRGRSLGTVVVVGVVTTAAVRSVALLVG